MIRRHSPEVGLDGVGKLFVAVAVGGPAMAAQLKRGVAAGIEPRAAVPAIAISALGYRDGAQNPDSGRSRAFLRVFGRGVGFGPVHAAIHVTIASSIRAAPIRAMPP